MFSECSADSFVITAYFVHRIRAELYVPYFFPKIRWWESHAESRAITFPAKIERQDKKTLEGEVLDFSRKGCFIKIREDFVQDETVHIVLRVQGQPLSCLGCVAWRTTSAVTHPKGIGIKFQPRGIRGIRKMIAIERKVKKIELPKEDTFEEQLSHFSG